MQTESFTNGSVLVGEYVTKLKVKGLKQGLKEWARDELAERSKAMDTHGSMPPTERDKNRTVLTGGNSSV